jgi:glycosyltransferase involved in cell wall biosynthesis
MTQLQKALWICSWYPNRTAELGGAFVKRHAEAAALYTDIAVLHAASDPSVKKGYRIETSHEPFFTIRIYYAPTTNPLLKIGRILQAYRKGYAQSLRTWGKADIVHLHVLYPAGIFAWFLYFSARLPFVVTEHRGGYIHKEGSYRGFFMKLFTQLTIKKARAVLAISEYFATAMRGHGLSNNYYTIVPNVVDTQLFAPSIRLQAQYLKPEKEVFQFLHVSMFDDRIKNIGGILRSVARLSERRTDFILNIIGGGYHHQRLLDLATELRILDKFVFFQGTKTHEEVAEMMREQSDAFILFSNIEGSPCVILEAMACGLPVIATETGGINERVHDETGILLNIGDEQGLVEAMNQMIDNKGKYDPSVIRQKIVEKCSIEAVGKAIATVYEEVLSKPPP